MSKMFADWGGRSVYTKNNNSTYIMVVYQLVSIFLKIAICAEMYVINFLVVYSLTSRCY